MQKKISNSLGQSIQDYSSVSTLPQQVIEFFESRIETQQQYAKALQRLNNKFPNIETHPTESSKVLKHLKGIHSEKYHQTLQFISELREDKNNFQNAISKFNQELQKSVSEVKMQQVNLKNIIDKINKLHTKGQEEIRHLDEKFLLRELTWLGSEYRGKKIQQSIKILDQQNKICLSLKNEYEELKTEGEKTIKRIKKNEKTIVQNSPLIEKQIIELVKKYTVQEVSLIRNLQYDIDTMIKRTNIFDEIPEEQQKQKVKAPKNAIVKTAKDLFKVEFKVKDYFEETKKNIATLNEAGLKTLQKRRDESKNKQLEEFVKIWIQNRSIEGLLLKLSDNFQGYKAVAQQFFQHFRNKNVNKFSQKEFIELNKLFVLLVDKYIQQKDFPALQKLVYFGSCYTYQPDKGNSQTLFELIKKKQIFSDIYFWKFLLFFVITKSVCESIQIIHEKQMHMKNNVFSSLVSNCMNMIGCGIDKYMTKNTVAKMAKSFGLEKTHVEDLLKFIENGWQKYQKQKNKK